MSDAKKKNYAGVAARNDRAINFLTKKQWARNENNIYH